MTIDIKVAAESRSEKAFATYNDQVKHGYNPNYVNPGTLRIIIQTNNLSSGTNFLEWRVTRRSDHKQFTKSGRILPQLFGGTHSIGFNLPSEGFYDCQLIATLSSGRKESSPVRSINLRNFLIVIIGDLAAAGQGNPDTPGKPVKFGNVINPLAWIELIFDLITNWLKEEFTTASRVRES